MTFLITKRYLIKTYIYIYFLLRIEQRSMWRRSCDLKKRTVIFWIWGGGGLWSYLSALSFLCHWIIPVLSLKHKKGTFKLFNLKLLKMMHKKYVYAYTENVNILNLSLKFFIQTMKNCFECDFNAFLYALNDHKRKSFRNSIKYILAICAFLIFDMFQKV